MAVRHRLLCFRSASARYVADNGSLARDALSWQVRGTDLGRSAILDACRGGSGHDMAFPQGPHPRDFRRSGHSVADDPAQDAHGRPRLAAWADCGDHGGDAGDCLRIFAQGAHPGDVAVGTWLCHGNRCRQRVNLQEFQVDRRVGPDTHRSPTSSLCAWLHYGISESQSQRNRWRDTFARGNRDAYREARCDYHRRRFHGTCGALHAKDSRHGSRGAGRNDGGSGRAHTPCWRSSCRRKHSRRGREGSRHRTCDCRAAGDDLASVNHARTDHHLPHQSRKDVSGLLL